MKKCHVHQVYGTGIRTHDLYPEPPPITTRPGLPPSFFNVSVSCSTYSSKSNYLIINWKMHCTCNLPIYSAVFLKKMGQPDLFLIYFRLFKHTLQIWQQICMWKNVHPVYGDGIQTLEHESPPITTRPRLPPNIFKVSVVRRRLYALLEITLRTQEDYHWHVGRVTNIHSEILTNWMVYLEWVVLYPTHGAL